MGAPGRFAPGVALALVLAGCGAATAQENPRRNDAPTGPNGSDALSGAAGQPDGSGEEAPGGFRSRAEIERGIMSRLKEITTCHERELQGEPSLSGTVEVGFVIKLDGSVDHVRILSNTTGNPRMESCVREVTRSVRFNGGAHGYVSVQSPFRFHVSSHGSAETPEYTVHVTDARGRDRRDIQRRIVGQRNQFRACSRPEPELEGKIVVSFIIETDGTLSEFQVESNTTGSRPIEACLRDILLNLRLDGSDIPFRVTYPFVYGRVR